MRTCLKPGHACMRNIVSFSSFPCHRKFRAVGRALRYLISQILCTWAIPNLSVAGEHVKEGQAKLQKPAAYPCRCAMCQQPMAGPSNITVDAGQAYETLLPSSIFQDLLFVLRQAERTKIGLLSVYHSIRAIVGISKTLRTKFHDRTIIASKTILRCMTCYLHFKFYRFGDLVVHQTTGVPIGGFLSGVLLNLCLGCAENRHDKWLWPQIAEFWP